ncbi:major facilitator superfamily domain-containing protein [Aspergillus unguis]
MAVREPFPTQQLAILAICRLAEPIAFASILAYNYPFVKDVRGTPNNAAFYAGLLVSAFALAEASTAVVWGTISDKIGRKPVVLSGLIGVAISSLIFGLAKNYWVAVAARALGGLLNGNVAVMQTMVAEMVKCPEHEPLAYSMIPFMWFFGSIVGSSMGALLASPALLWPVLEGTLFARYPYLLPNLVAAIWILVAVILGALFLKETRVTALEKGVPGNHTPDETSRLLPGKTKPAASDAAVEPSSEGVALPRGLSNGVHAAEDESEGSGPEPSSWNRNMVLLILQLALVSYLQMVYGVLMPIYLVDSPHPDVPTGHLDLRGGFGFSVRRAGAVMSANGLMAIIVQGAIFAPFVSRVGVWKTFVWMTILAPLAYVVVPFITMAPRAHALVPIYMDMFAQNFMNIIVYPCLLILLKDSTPSVSILGRVNGMAMTCCSGARTIAPPLVGYIYGVGGSAAGWWSIGLVALLAGLLVPTIERPLRTPEAQGDETR